MLGHIIQKHTVCDQFVKDMDAFVSWKKIKNSKETPSMILVKLKTGLSWKLCVIQ